jgi:hypothetical protein
VFEVIRYVDDWSDDEALIWLALWRTLRLDDACIAILMDLQLRFYDGALHAAMHVQSDPNHLETVVAIVLTVWKFTKYTDSRWLSLGKAAQRLAAAEFLGITSML